MTDHPITPPPELVEQWRTAPEYTNCREKLTMVSMTTRRLQEITDQAARWGRPAPAPAGEVAELVEWLRDRAAGNEGFGAPHAGSQLTRAADLLERLNIVPPIESD